MQAHTLSSIASPLPDPPEDLSQADFGSGRFCSTAPALVHDASNLVAALSLYAELLGLPGVLRPEHAHYAEELRMLGDRSIALLRRARNGDQPFARSFLSSPKACAQTLRSLLPLLERIAGGTVAVRLKIDGPDASFPINNEALERIAVNLTRNAAQAIRTAPGRAGVITVAIEFTSDAVTFSVADNGPGMDPLIAHNFLQPRTDRLDSHLGLRIVSELTVGAAREVVTRPGRGTCFKFTWPLSQKPSVERPER